MLKQICEMTRNKRGESGVRTRSEQHLYVYSHGMGPGQVGMGGNIYRLNRTLRRREGGKEGGFRMFKRNSPMIPDEKWYMLNILLCRQSNFFIKLTTARHQKIF